MKLCDVTIAYNDRSGGIKTYIDEKRRFLRDHTDLEHLLIVPGPRDRIRRSGRATTVTIRAPLLPGQNAYRLFLTPAKIRRVLKQEQPDAIELGSCYTAPWASFGYRRARREAGAACTVGAYFHTDVAEAYVAAPLRAAAHAWLDDVSEALAKRAEKIADIAAGGAEKYIGSIFRACDLALAASPRQAARLQQYGVDDVRVVPMGVDLRLFTPSRRCEALRAELGAGPQSAVLIYAGRLCAEKRVQTVIEAFARLPAALEARLWLVGDGPLRAEAQAAAARNPAVRLIPYEGSRARFAALLASADLYVTAGPFETFGLSVIEAQASGLPVVGVAAGALKERVPEGLGYLGPVDDPAAMACHIVRAWQGRDRLGAAARAHAAAHFSWTGALRQWLACYEPTLAPAVAARRRP